MFNKLLINKGFISIPEASKLVPYTYKEIRNWCIKNQKHKLAFKHSNKWYLHKESFLNHISSLS